MTILVQSFLNSATRLSTTATTATTVAQLKTLVNVLEGVSTSTMQFYIVNPSTTSTALVSGTLGSYGITTATTIYSSNTISTATSKVDRQLAKLELAQLRRQAGGDTSSTFYRIRNVYDIDLLADKYTSNTSTIGTTSTLSIGRPWPPVLGMDDPANIAEPEATAWVLMDGPYGDEYGFYAGQSWRKLAPIGYSPWSASPPYPADTYTYGSETVRFDGTVWVYENLTGVIATGGGLGQYPWQATWTGSYTAAKVTSTYVKTTNYPTVP
jgi:hypothetical protein